MFGRLFSRNILVAALLLGFCVYVVLLFLRGQINLYIHPRYDMFSLIMAGYAIVLLLAGAVVELRGRAVKPRLRFRLNVVDILVVTVLALAFLLPAQALSSQAVARKALNTPRYEASQAGGGTGTKSTVCPETKPDSVEMWVDAISTSPINCYKGETIELTGFVLQVDDSPLPNDMYYLGRMVMSCCIVDARPFALPIQKDSFGTYPKDTWLTVKGKLQASKVNGSVQLVIEPESVQEIEDPTEPYDYINTPSVSPAAPLIPL